jgi:hypothetical protein
VDPEQEVDEPGLGVGGPIGGRDARSAAKRMLDEKRRTGISNEDTGDRIQRIHVLSQWKIGRHGVQVLAREGSGDYACCSDGFF